MLLEEAPLGGWHHQNLPQLLCPPLPDKPTNGFSQLAPSQGAEGCSPTVPWGGMLPAPDEVGQGPLPFARQFLVPLDLRAETTGQRIPQFLSGARVQSTFPRAAWSWGTRVFHTAAKLPGNRADLWAFQIPRTLTLQNS